MLLPVVSANPQSKSRERRRESRDLEREGLQRGIAPRLVIRRENCEVHSVEEVVVGHIEHSVVSIEIGRDEIYLHLRMLRIVEPEIRETMGYGVILGTHKIVRNLRRV